MKKIACRLFLAVLPITLVSCQSIPILRNLASQQEESIATDYYETKIDERFLKDQLRSQKQLSERYRQTSPLQRTNSDDIDPKLISQINELEKRAANLKIRLAQNKKPSGQPTKESYLFNKNWRQHHDEFILHNLEDYALNNGQIQKQMTLSTDTTKRFLLQLSNKALTWNGRVASNSLQLGQAEAPRPLLKARIQCDQQIIHHRLLGNKTVAKGKSYDFDWHDIGHNAPSTIIELSHPDTHCDFYFHQPEQSQEYGIRFVPEHEQMQQIQNPNLSYEICYLPTNKNLKGMDQFLTDSQTNHMTCPQKIDNFKTLENPYDGLRAKVKALTGQDLTDDEINTRDPFRPLDFSQAPKLDAIFISYLVFRSDYTGNILLQALRHHAAQGAIIRIAVSEVISLGKDRQQLLDLQAKYPSVKLIFYKYKNQNLGLRDKFAELHRNNHIKLFLTYSQTQPENNIVIFGGRNIHDGFLFDQLSANYIYPTLVDYRPGGDENWAHWEDFETLFQSIDLVKTIMGQFYSILNADYASVFTRNYTEIIPTNSEFDPKYLDLKENEVILRSFVSVPFKDDMRLESTYVKMIDAAQSEIKISTPYFHLTDKLMQALVRASDRGVKIELITRLELKGDTADIILGEVNKTAINALYQKIKIYEYTTVGKILHSKLFIIDGKFVMMGSVNLNKRSFYHDFENATLVYGQGFNRKINSIFENYKKESKLLTEKQKTVFWKKVLIKAFEKEL